MPRENWVYIVTNTHNTVVYVGSTSDLEERIAQHKAGAGSGSAAKHKCWKLVEERNPGWEEINLN